MFKKLEEDAHNGENDLKREEKKTVDFGHRVAHNPIPMIEQVGGGINDLVKLYSKREAIYGGTGAMIGSMIPGVGTAGGAAIGSLYTAANTAGAGINIVRHRAHNIDKAYYHH